MTKRYIGPHSVGSTASFDELVRCFKLTNHKLTFALLEHLKASANSGILLTVPSTRNRLGEWGSVRIRWTWYNRQIPLPGCKVLAPLTAVAGFIARAHICAKEMKNSWSLHTMKVRSGCEERCIDHLVKLSPGRRYSLPSFQAMSYWAFHARYAWMSPVSPIFSPEVLMFSCQTPICLCAVDTTHKLPFTMT